MDWNGAIEKNREALKRILASLVAMAGLGNGHSAIASRQSESEPAQVANGADCLLPTADCRILLPRHLHRAVLGLLRPAEAAARRLIIVAARGLVVALPPARPRKPKPLTTEPLLRGFGIAVVMSPADLARVTAAARQAAVTGAGRPRILSLSKGSLPLFDPLPCLLRLSKGRDRRRYVPAHAAPRISGLDLGSPFRPLPPPPSPDDPIDATRLALRLEALSSALNDLPAYARRFARRRARAAEAGRGRRWPLRPGRPPGQPRANRRTHEVHEILHDLHGLAFDSLEHPDTS
jgi:hypothetical protein